MTAKPPAHGSEARYRTCRCPACRRAQTRACQLRELAHLAGRPPMYPREPLMAHIRSLHESGMSTNVIARRAGVPEATLRGFVNGHTNKIRRPHALAVLAVPPRDFDIKAWHAPLGTVRRVRALYAIGHSPDDIAATAGLCRSLISTVAHGRKDRLSGKTVEAVRLAYRQLAWKPGSSTITRRRAAQQGWHGPLDWDGDIDDPATQPEQADAEPEPRSTKRDEVRHLLLSGESVRTAHERTGASLSYVRQLAQEVLEGHVRDRRRSLAGEAA